MPMASATHSTGTIAARSRSEEHTSELQSRVDLVCRLLREKKTMLEPMQSPVRQIMGFELPPPPNVDGYLKDGESLNLGDETIRVLHTPGHSPGSILLSADG